MQNGQLLSHIDTDLVTREQLALVETPDATRSFKPVPHIELINTLDEVLGQNQIAIRKEQFALRRDGSTLFGVLQLVYENTEDGIAALGLRTANNKTMSIQICAGLSVFVCDNLVFRGDLIALNRKHTSGLELRTELSTAVLRFQEHFGRLTGEIDALKRQELTDTQAKAIIHDLARQAAATGAAVVIASSDDSELCDCCDRVLVVRDGHIAGVLEGDAINSHALARLQLAPVI